MILTGDISPSLPAPATVSGRYHMLINSDGVSVTWTSSGSATPFLVQGLNVASVAIPRGGMQLVFSNGAQWVAVNAQTGAKRTVAATGTSNASGDATYAFSPAFAALPVISANIQTTNTNATEARITALSTSSVTINVRQSPGVVVLGLSVLQVPQPLVGATVHMIAVEAG